MGAIEERFDEVYRDFQTDGVAASGLHEPAKADIRAIGRSLEQAISSSTLGSLLSVKSATAAALAGDLAHDAGSVALVYADADDANNDLWIKSGASGAGAWTVTTIIHDTIHGLAQTFVDAAETAATDAASERDYAHARNRVPDPQLEAYSVGDTVAWGTVSNTVVQVGTDKMLRTPLSAATGGWPSVWDVTIADLQTGRFSASAVIDDKAATSAGELYFQVAALNSGGSVLNVASLFPLSDSAGNANDGNRDTGFHRYFPTGAITEPTRVVICEGLDTANLVANGAVSLRIYVHSSASNRATFGLVMAADGNSAVYRPPYVAKKTVDDNATSTSLNAIAVADLTQRGNVFADPHFQQSAPLAKQSSGTGSSAVWSGISAQSLTTSADGEASLTVTNGTVVVKTPASLIGTTGDTFTFGLKVNQRAYGGSGNMNIYVNQLDSAGAQISGSVQYLKQNATSTSTTPETVWVTGTLASGAAQIGLTIQASSNAANKFEVSRIDLHRGSKQVYRPNLNFIGCPDVYYSTTGSDAGRGTHSDPFLTSDRAMYECRRANDRLLVGRIWGYGGDYTPPSVHLGDSNGSAQPFAGHLQFRALERQRVRWICPTRTVLSSITKTAGRVNVYQAPLAVAPPDMNGEGNYCFLFEQDTPFDAIAAAQRRALHRGRSYRSPHGIMQRVADVATCDATPNSYTWSGGVIYFYPPTADPTTNGKTYFVPATTDASTASAIQYAVPAYGTRRAGELILSGIDFLGWRSATKLDGLAWAELDDCRALANSFVGFEFGSSCGIARRCSSVGNTQDGFGWYPGSLTSFPVAETFRPGRWTMEDCYAALCGDDAVSMHVLSDVVLRGGLFEKIGDAGIAPALGGTCDVSDVRVWQAGSSWYIGGATRTGEGLGLRQGSTDAGGDQRSGTCATVRNSEFEACLYGLRSGNWSGNRLDARGVLTIDCGTHYFKDPLSTLELTDCRSRGTGTVTSGAPTVITSNAVA